jgi:hypothetical protein
MAVTEPLAASARDSTHGKSWRAEEVTFCIGDEVRDGLHVGTVTDVGTVLVQVKTSIGSLRMVCPWELVRVQATREGPRSVTSTG